MKAVQHPRVRRARPDDLAAIVDVLVESHTAYVWEQWMLPGPRRSSKIRALVSPWIEQVALPFGEVWVADDLTTVAVWATDQVRELPIVLIEGLARVADEVLGVRRATVDSVEAFIRLHRPIQPHWFLETMGTRPAAQRQGIGTAVLQPVLAHLDRIEMPACLETSSDANVRFYERSGFVSHVTLDALEDGAPTTDVMVRMPARLVTAQCPEVYNSRSLLR